MYDLCFLKQGKPPKKLGFCETAELARSVVWADSGLNGSWQDVRFISTCQVGRNTVVPWPENAMPSQQADPLLERGVFQDGQQFAFHP
jgi:hypothetical protein